MGSFLPDPVLTKLSSLCIICFCCSGDLASVCVDMHSIVLALFRFS